MLLLSITGLFDIRIVDIIDVILFSVLLYEVYNLVKGTAAIRIFIGIIAVYLIWKVVKAFQMQLLSEILGQFISVGFIALIVVFQPEIRQFLLLVGNTRIIRSTRKRFLFWKFQLEDPIHFHIDTIVKACQKMADTYTGALIVITGQNELKAYIETGQVMDARISEFLLETIFFKNSPLHDGAVIITGGTIRAAIMACGTAPPSGSPKNRIPLPLWFQKNAEKSLTATKDTCRKRSLPPNCRMRWRNSLNRRIALLFISFSFDV